MQPIQRLAFLAALVAVLLAAPALAWDETKFKSQVQGMLDQAAAGFVKQDAQAVAALSAPQATFKFRDGSSLSLDQWMQATTQEFADWREVRSQFVVEKACPKGKGQIGAVYSERHEFNLVSDPGHRHGISARFRVLLTKTPQGWRFLEFTELSAKFTRDGKPLRPTGPARPAKTQG